MRDDDVSKPGPRTSSPVSAPTVTRTPPGSPAQTSDDKDALSAISLPTIATPKGGGAIRSIGETFRANAVTGTGALGVPLPLSPGRGGSGPKLTLAYDSGQGQSPFGMGWSVDIPSISRRTDKGLPQYRDADESDEFVLSGAEVLVPTLVATLVNGVPQWQPEAVADPSGVYGIERYRPRIDTAFARIEKRTNLTTGEVHWRTVTKDNVVSLFGKSAAARIADPKKPWRVFRWLLETTFDDRGNVTWFEYKPEDTANVPNQPAEKTRLADPQSFANQYIKRIHYGNQAPVATDDPGAADLGALTWHFEAVFDYGEHNVASPRPTEDQLWACRADPFSSFRSTFDVRTYRLCQRLLIFHTFDALCHGAPTLVRSLGLAYQQTPLIAYLCSVTETGWMGCDGSYSCASMPRLDLAYTPANLRTGVQMLDPESVVNMPGGVDGGRYRWIDLDGEGIPGVLTQQAGALFYKRNEGSGCLARADALRAKPSVTTLGLAGQTLSTLDGDGQMDLVLLGESVRGFFERDEHGWSPFRRFVQTPNFDPADPNLRFLDIDGDGLPDVLVAEDDVFVWCRSLGKDGFGRPHVVKKSSDENVGPNFVFADATQSIFTADMTGDGLVDLVRVRNGEICYWPNLGYGIFGAKVTMGNAPRFDRPEAFDPKRLRFGDVDGTGTSDIAYVRADGVALYLNQSGNCWSDACFLAGIPGRREGSVDLVDLLGTGTSCLVWSSPQPADATSAVRYVDLMASTKPHLLCSVANNLGLTTRIGYASSTTFYLQARASGSPWVTRLPFPVQVVARVETCDAVQQTRLVTTYSYKHGYFDGSEREFRGFGLVEQCDAESYSSAVGQSLVPLGLNEQDGDVLLAPVRTKSWFDTGAWREARDLYKQYRTEWYSGDSASTLPDPTMPACFLPQGAREAARARKGTRLRKEVYADDGTPAAAVPYAVEEHGYEVVCLQPVGGQRHAAFFTHEREQVTWHYERNPSDARVEHAFTLQVDVFNNVTCAAHVAYPRRPPAPGSAALEPEQTVLLAACTQASFVNETTNFYRVGVPIETFAYELTGLSAPTSGLLAFSDVLSAVQTATPIPFETMPASQVFQKRLYQQRRTLYWKDDLSVACPVGSIESRALVYEVYGKALTSGLVSDVFGSRVTATILSSEGGYANLDGDGDWWRPSGQYRYDSNNFYQATGLIDPFDNRASVQLDPYGLLAIATHSSQNAALDNVVQAQNDYRVLHPVLVTDPNGNQTQLAFDELGMLVKTAVMGKAGGTDGDTIDSPTSCIAYDLLAWQKNQTPASVYVSAREQHGVATTPWQHTYSYSDGSGHEVLRKSQAATPDPSGAARWIGTGRTVFDNKGNPVKKYEPYFSLTSGYEVEAAMQGVTPILRYDPLSRLIETDYPDGSFETVEFDAWSETHADANDNVIRSQWYATYSAATALPQMQRAARLAKVHANTPTVRTVDPLGRVFLVVEDNGTFGKYATRTALDIQGNAISITDANGNRALVQAFDLEKRVLHSTSVDAGDRFTLQDVVKNVFRAWDGRPFAIRNTYDGLRRLSGVYVLAQGASTEILAELLVYGAPMGSGGPAANNQCGRKVLHYDGAGELSLSSYDFKGNLTTTTRTLAATYTQTADWTPTLASPSSPSYPLTDPAAIHAAAVAAGLFETPVSSTDPAVAFTTTSTFDALNRVTTTTTPDGSVTTFSYNAANLLQAVSATVKGVTAQYVSGLDYNPKGQRCTAIYGNNATKTTYRYDAQTFFLCRQTTVGLNKTAATLQDLCLFYDPVHNVVEIDDNADQTLYFSGTTSVVPGGGQYQYDPIYRLICATGREQPGQQGPVAPDNTDPQVWALPNPNDVQAMRGYTETYSYDPAGNIMLVTHQQMMSTGGSPAWTRPYAYVPGTNRLCTTSSGTSACSYKHDSNGNMCQMPSLATISWDHADRMQCANLGGGGTSYYAYDGTGTRVRKIVQRPGGITEERIYLGTYEVYRESTIGANGQSSVQQELQTLHVMDDRRRVALVESTTVDGGNAVASAAPQPRFQLNGHLESSLVEVDADGALISYEEYFPYGATSFHSAAGSLQVSAKRYRYTGKERDEETGLSYHGARYYAQWLGRWLSTDPAGLRQGPNNYYYVTNRPISYIDPTGRQGTNVISDAWDTSVKGVNDANRAIHDASFAAGGAIVDKTEDTIADLGIKNEFVTGALRLNAQLGATVVSTSLEVAAGVLMAGANILPTLDVGGKEIGEGLGRLFYGEDAGERVLGALQALSGIGKGAEVAIQAFTAERSWGSATVSGEGITANKAHGDVFESTVGDARDVPWRASADQVTIRPNVGPGQPGTASDNFRIDRLEKSAITGEYKLVEAKGTPSAPLTDNQIPGFANFEKYGGEVRGAAGGTIAPHGTQLPPSSVMTVRPLDLFQQRVLPTTVLQATQEYARVRQQTGQ